MNLQTKLGTSPTNIGSRLFNGHIVLLRDNTIAYYLLTTLIGFCTTSW